MGRKDIDQLRGKVGTFEAPIGAVQLPSEGVRLDRRGDPKPLQSGQDEHPEPAPREKRKRRQPEPELVFQTDLFVQAPADRAVFSACHRALAGKFITEHELRTKLVKGEHDEAAIERGIEKCRATGLIDDERYTTTYVESRVRRGHGAQRIRQDLARRGIDRALVDAALVDHQETGAFDDAALDAARTKFRRVDLGVRASEAKAMRWLLSRGYSSAQAGGALRALRTERAEAADEA